MELRWYWRVLQRQARVIWTSLVVVALLAAAYTAYSWYGTRYKTTVTLEFVQRPPILGGTSNSQDPNSLALGQAIATTNDAKLYTEQITFFKGVSARLKREFGVTMDYKALQGGLGALPIGQRELEMEYKASNSTRPAQIVQCEVEQIENNFIPTYNRDVVQPGARGLVTTFPVEVRIFDPINTRSQSTLSVVSGWLLKSLLGLVLGVALAFLWEYLDESIQDEHDVRGWMQGAPTLGVIPGGKSRVA